MIRVAMANTKTDVATQLLQLHDEIDRQATTIAERNRDRIQCRRGCCSCCVDDLTVFEIEASRITRAHTALLRDGTPHPPGACAFLDGDGACRIYADRPYTLLQRNRPQSLCKKTLIWFRTL